MKLTRQQSALTFACVLGGCVLATRPVSAQVLFDQPFFSTAHPPTAVATGDLNGDGSVDAVYVSREAGRFVVRLNNGDGVLSVGHDRAAGVAPSDVVLHDLDGDGSLDLAITDAVGGSVIIRRGRGDGTFRAPNEYVTGDGARALAVTDVDRDGVPDLVVVNATDETLSVLFNNGNATLQPAVNTLVGNAPSGVASGDFDGDGDPDLAITRTTPTEGNTIGDLLVMKNVSGAFVVDATYLCGLDPASPAIGDLTGDGRPDIAVVNSGGISLAVLTNRGSYGFGDGTVEANQYYLVGGAPADVAIADLNGDGDLDTVVLASDAIVVLFNTGLGLGSQSEIGVGLAAYSVEDPVAEVAGASAIALEDFDGNGEIDFLSAGRVDEQGHLILALSRGDATFSQSVAYAVHGNGLGNGPRAVAFADLNADEAIDMFTVNPGTNDVTYLSNAGDGTYGEIYVEGGYDPPASRPSYPVSGSKPIAIAAGALDDQGGPDVVTVDHFSAGVTVMYNANNASLSQGASYPTAILPTSVILADLDGDEHLDIVVGHLIGNRISILPNIGDGTFAETLEVEAGSGPRSVAAADLDGDGDLDLAVANKTAGTISILDNAGGMMFTAASTISVPTPHSIAAGDWDGDGKIDLAVSNEETGRIHAFANLGNAAFGAPVAYEARLGASFMSAGDLDGNGSDDLAVANGTRSISLLYAFDGAFSVVHHRTGVARTTFVGMADLDSNGTLDLAVTDGEFNRVGVMESLLEGVQTGPCLADINASGQVGFDDVLEVLNAWGPCSGACPADVEVSGQVGFDDLLFVLNSWGCVDSGGPGPGPLPGGTGSGF